MKRRQIVIKQSQYKMQSIKKVYIGCDHAAFEMKEQILQHLKSKMLEIEDMGTFSLESCHYPEFGYAAAKATIQDQNSLGILICGSGVGISISANKVKGIRCALCHDYYSAEQARTRDHCNMLAFGARIIGVEVAKQMVDVFLASKPIVNEVTLKRLKQLKDLEDKTFL